MSGLLLAAVGEDAKVHLTSQTRIIAAILAVAFMVLILELIRRGRLQERYSVVWFIAGLGMLAGAAHVELTTGEDDAEALRLYESAGFTNREGRPDGPRMLYYERDL